MVCWILRICCAVYKSVLKSRARAEEVGWQTLLNVRKLSSSREALSSRSLIKLDRYLVVSGLATRRMRLEGPAASRDLEDGGCGETTGSSSVGRGDLSVIDAQAVSESVSSLGVCVALPVSEILSMVRWQQCDGHKVVERDSKSRTDQYEWTRHVTLAIARPARARSGSGLGSSSPSCHELSGHVLASSCPARRMRNCHVAICSWPMSCTRAGEGEGGVADERIELVSTCVV